MIKQLGTSRLLPPLLLTLTILASCQSLPERRTTEDRVLALLLTRPEGVTLPSGVELSAKTYPANRKILLKEGWNFVRFAPTETLWWIADFEVHDPKNHVGYSLAPGTGYKIPQPPEGTIQVLPFQLSCYPLQNGDLISVRSKVEPLPAERLDEALALWNKENSGRAPSSRWTAFTPWVPPAP